MIRLRVVGVRFRNPDGSSRQDILAKIYDDYYTEAKDAKLSLVREPENPVDSNAVSVEFKGQRVGYVPAEEAKKIGALLDKGRIKRVKIREMIAARGISLELEIRLKKRSTVKDNAGRTFRFE